MGKTYARSFPQVKTAYFQFVFLWRTVALLFRL